MPNNFFKKLNLGSCKEKECESIFLKKLPLALKLSEIFKK